MMISFALYPVWISFVYKYQMGEDVREDGPQSHLKKKGTPTMGGLVFLVTVSLVTFIFNKSRTQTLFPLLVAAMAGLFGIVEDLSKLYRTSGLRQLLMIDGAFNYKKGDLASNIAKKTVFKPFIKVWRFFFEFTRIIGSTANIGLQTYQKLLIQGFIGGFVAYWAYVKLGWDYIWFPLIGDVHIGILYPIFIFFLFIAVLNFVAFTDGLDGLAGGLGIIAFAAFWVLASRLGYNSLGTLAATFIGAMLPFLYFNVYPARIFMGNVGSHVLGSVLAVFAVVLHREVALFFILGVYLMDGISSPLQQFSNKLTGKRIFRMAPMHHHFELLGWPETKVVLRFWIVSVMLTFVGILIALL